MDRSVSTTRIDGLILTPGSALGRVGRRVIGVLFYRNVQWFRGGLVFKAHRLVYHSTLGLGGPASRHGSLNSLFQVDLHLPSYALCFVQVRGTPAGIGGYGVYFISFNVYFI